MKLQEMVKVLSALDRAIEEARGNTSIPYQLAIDLATAKSILLQELDGQEIIISLKPE